MNTNRKRVGQTALGGVMLLAVGLVVAVFLPLPPQGRFSTPDVLNTADAYYELSGGRLTQVAFDGARGRDGKEHRFPVANYRKEGNRWVATTPDGRTFELRATPLSLQITGLPAPYQAKTLCRYEVCSGR